jgi:HK97 family phage portal protein
MSSRKQRKREARAAIAGDPIFASVPTGLSTGGMFVTPHLAENLSTLLACVSAISTSIASLPFQVYQTGAGGRLEAPSHPLARLMCRGPNMWQTGPDFIEWLLAQTLLHGNGVAEIVTDGAGRVVELRPVPWGWVNINMLPSGRLVYDVSDITSVYGGSGRSRRLLQDEVLHIRDRTDDGLIGRSRLQRARSAVGQALALQNFASSMWKNQAVPSGVVQTKKRLSEDGLAGIRTEFERVNAGSGNARRVMVLDNEMEFKAISMSAEDAELLASRRFSVEEMARLYGVPPTIIGDLTNSSFTNAETLLRYFAQFTLRAWTTKLEAEFGRAVFTSDEAADHAVCFDMSAFLRGDPQARWTAHQMAVTSGILTRNEVREIEGFNPRPDGEALMIPTAPTPPAPGVMPPR